MTNPKPCPFCGCTVLYTGHLLATAMGVQCNCGARMQVNYPDRMPRGQTMKTIESYLLEKAIKQWNKRK